MTENYDLSCSLFSFLSGRCTNDGSLRRISLKKVMRPTVLTKHFPELFETTSKCLKTCITCTSQEWDAKSQAAVQAEVEKETAETYPQVHVHQLGQFQIGSNEIPMNFHDIFPLRMYNVTPTNNWFEHPGPWPGQHHHPEVRQRETWPGGAWAG